MFEVSTAWKSAYPDAHVGVLALRNVTNPSAHAGLERQRQALEAELRARFAGQDRQALQSLPILQAYAAYYKRFKKTYHLQLQLESVVFKDKSIPGGAALIEAMFMAELQNLLLTAGHDLDALDLPARLEAAKGGETYILLRGEAQALKAGDMFIADREGILSSIIYGPDERTRIRPDTQAVIYTVYAPPGIGAAAVGGHLQDIEDYVRLFAPQAQVEMSCIFGPER